MLDIVHGSSLENTLPVPGASGLGAFGLVLMRNPFEMNLPTKPSISSTVIAICHLFLSSTSTLSSE